MAAIRDPDSASSRVDKSPEGSPSAPILIDLGKRKRKQVKRLRRGRGPLLNEVEELLAELRAEGSIAPGAQPVVIVVQPKRRKGGGWF